MGSIGTKFAGTRDRACDYQEGTTPTQPFPLWIDNVNWFDAFLRWLEHSKPLWDFLTAVGTVGLAVVTFLLATRKPKAELTLSEIRSGTAVAVIIRNTGDAMLTIARFYWTAAAPGKQVELGFSQPGFGLFNGVGPIPFLQARLSRGDTVEVRVSVQQMAEAINPHIRDDATVSEIAESLRSSRFGCATTTGEQFYVDISEATYVDVRGRLAVMRPGHM